MRLPVLYEQAVSDYPWASLFGWEFIKAVMVSLFIGAAAFGLLGFVAGGAAVYLFLGGL